MSRRNDQGELQPLRAFAGDQRAFAEERAQARLAAAWPLLVGDALARKTRPLRIHRRTLVLGCWENRMVPNLRHAAQAAWPDVQARLQRFLGLQLQRIEVVPCDPLPASEPAPPAPPADALLAVLQRLRTLAKER